MAYFRCNDLVHYLRFACITGFLPLLFFIATPFAEARTVLSEVMWAGSDLSSADEWVEIACSKDEGDEKELCDLSGWSLTYLDAKSVEQTMATFPVGTSIGYGRYFLVSNFAESESRLAITPDIVTSAVSLPNTKLLLRLRDASGNVVDEVDDGVGDPFAGLNLSGTGTKASMERLDLSISGTLKSNWVTATTAISLDLGSSVLGTPGAAHPQGCCSSSFSSFSSSSAFSSFLQSVDSSLRITEVLPNPEGADTDEWIEIGNLGDDPVTIAGLTLSTDTGSSRRSFTIPIDASGGILLPGVYRSFRSNQTRLTLANAGSSVRLLSSSLLLDELTYPEVPEGMSYGRDTVTAERKIFCIPTERSANADIPIGLSIAVQSGQLQGTEDVTLNLASAANDPTALNGAACRWDYTDGYKPETCNPPSHTLSSSGVHLITLLARLACGREERATVTVRIDPKLTLEKTAITPSPDSGELPHIILSAAMPYGHFLSKGWVSVRNTGDEPVDLLSFSLHGGLIPNDHHTFASLKLLPREERRFSLEFLRLDLPETAELILRDPEGEIQSVLAWRDVSNNQIIRPPVHPLGSIAVKVLRVLDGDTLEVALLDTNDTDIPPSVLQRWRRQELSDSASLRLRLIGIDAPELFTEDGSIYEQGLKALKFASALIDNKKIELQFDTILWDKYERILAYARLPESEETLQSALLKSGNASAERGFDHPSLDEFIALEGEAKSKKYGIWAKAETPKIFVSTAMVFSSKSFSSFPPSSGHSSSRSSSSKVHSSTSAIVKKTTASAAGWMKVKWVGASSSSTFSLSPAAQTGVLSLLRRWEIPSSSEINTMPIIRSKAWYKRFIDSFCIFLCQ